MAPTFSVVLPTHNRPDMLPTAVESVLAQDYDDFECIVVDDGSTTPLELPDDPRLRLVRHDTNLGLPSALNTGLEHARAEYITFLDDDDEFTPDRLSLVLPALPRADVVVCWAEATDPPPIVNRRLEGRVYDEILDDRTPHKGTVVIPKERTPRFDERYLALEDVEWWLRVSEHLSVTTVARVGYRQIRHPGVRSTNGPSARIECGKLLLQERAEYFARHRRAAALRWKTLAAIALDEGDRPEARRALLHSIRAHPTAGALRILAAAMRPS